MKRAGLLLLLTAACLPGPEILESRFPARVLLVGLYVGDRVEVSVGGLTRGLVAGASSTELRFALDEGSYSGRVVLERDPLDARCASFELVVAAEGGVAAVSLDTPELIDLCVPIEPPPPPPPFIVEIPVSLEEIVGDGEFNQRRTLINVDGTITVSESDETTTGTLSPELVDDLLSSLRSDAIAALFDDGCDGDTTLRLRRTYLVVDGDNTRSVSELIDAGGCADPRVDELVGFAREARRAVEVVPAEPDLCGNGVREADELCDTGGLQTDLCVACVPAAGVACFGSEPDRCTNETFVVIPDDVPTLADAIAALQLVEKSVFILRAGDHPSAPLPDDVDLEILGELGTRIINGSGNETIDVASEGELTLHRVEVVRSGNGRPLRVDGEVELIASVVSGGGSHSQVRGNGSLTLRRVVVRDNSQRGILVESGASLDVENSLFFNLGDNADGSAIDSSGETKIRFSTFAALNTDADRGVFKCDQPFAQLEGVLIDERVALDPLQGCGPALQSSIDAGQLREDPPTAPFLVEDFHLLVGTCVGAVVSEVSDRKEDFDFLMRPRSLPDDCGFVGAP